MFIKQMHQTEALRFIVKEVIENRKGSRIGSPTKYLLDSQIICELSQIQSNVHDP